MGCTEPIALSHAAAKAREVLGCLPVRVCIGASGRIIKNVQSVIVPNTNHLKGIPAAAAAGIVAVSYTHLFDRINDLLQVEGYLFAVSLNYVRLYFCVHVYPSLVFIADVVCAHPQRCV